jgi:hypothetical protein
MTDEIKKFVSERNAALQSLDEQTIRAFFRKWTGREMTDADPNVFWGAIHKAITGATDLPIELRRKSKAWLDAHGLKSFDDGDLEGAAAGRRYAPDREGSAPNDPKLSDGGGLAQPVRAKAVRVG